MFPRPAEQSIMGRKLPPANAEERIASGRRQLLEAMAAHGMTEAGGWSIAEETRAGVAGSFCMLRPRHATLPTPAGYAVAVKLDD